MIKGLSAKPRSKKTSGEEAFEILRFAARDASAVNSHSTGTAAQLSNLTRLVHNTASRAGYRI